MQVLIDFDIEQLPNGTSNYQITSYIRRALYSYSFNLRETDRMRNGIDAEVIILNDEIRV